MIYQASKAPARSASLLSVSQEIPGRNEFFRTHPDFRPVIPIVDIEVGMERKFFAVDDDMVTALAGIGIRCPNQTLYLTVTARGAVKIIPVRNAGEDNEQNEYARTKEIALVRGIEHWVRLYTDQENVAATRSIRRRPSASPIRNGRCSSRPRFSDSHFESGAIS